MMKKIVILVLLSLLAIAVIGPLSLSAKDGASQKAVVAAPIIVNVTKAISKTIPQQIEALGTLSAVNNVNISAEVSGRIDQIFFKDGQQVAKGMPILQLDNTSAQAQYETAKAQLNVSQTKLDRANLVSGTFSKQDIDAMNAQVISDKAAVKTALASLQQTTLTAPFSGVLGAFKVSVGDYVNQGDTLVPLINKNPLLVKYAVSQNYLTKLKLGQQVTLTSDAFKHKVFYGVVSFISPNIDKNTGTIAMQATVNNDKGLLSPGMFVHLTQTIDQILNAVLIPEECVVTSVKGDAVYRVVNGQAVMTNITLGERITTMTNAETGASLSGQVQVLKGVAVNDVIVSAGQQKLQDGSLVTIADDSAASDTSGSSS